MIDFVKACDIAFDYLSKYEIVKKIGETDKKQLKLPLSLEVWELSTEILHNEEIHDIILYILVLPEFPYAFPKILLSQPDFDEFKYLPHVDNDRIICTFDTDLSRPDPNQPGQVILETVRKAKKILEEGINKQNRADFIIEFRSYWDQTYSDDDKIEKNILSLIEQPINNSIKLCVLSKKLKSYKYILHSSDEYASIFKSFLDDFKFEFEEIDVLLLENIGIQKIPPFTIRNSDILKLLSERTDELKKYKLHINSDVYPKLTIISENEIPILIGWFHKPFKTQRNGFRSGNLTNFKVFSSFQKNDKVIRVLPEVLTLNRLSKRSKGEESESGSELRIGIAGVGSIGSNLIYFLNSLNYPELRLIDNDELKIENIGRHLLGFEYTGMKKSIALKRFLLSQNPLQKISTSEKSIITVCQNNIDSINQLDCLFICIGKTNIEKWIGEAIEDNLISIPVFFIWVEPYLAGGHCLYIHPESKAYNSYFEDDLLQSNVISNVEYNNNNSLLSLKEAGCQTTYIPYSSFSIVTFLSALFPLISETIIQKNKESKLFTWIGNKKHLEEMGITLSEFAKQNIEGKIIVT